MRSGAANTKVATGYDRYLSAERRSVDYGDLVGHLLVGIEAWMTESPSSFATTPQARRDVDVVHIVSIAAGYIGLAAGFALSGATLVWLAS